MKKILLLSTLVYASFALCEKEEVIIGNQDISVHPICKFKYKIDDKTKKPICDAKGHVYGTLVCKFSDHVKIKFKNAKVVPFLGNPLSYLAILDKEYNDLCDVTGDPQAKKPFGAAKQCAIMFDSKHTKVKKKIRS